MNVNTPNIVNTPNDAAASEVYPNEPTTSPAESKPTGSLIKLLLPAPNDDEVTRFITLYQDQYGIALEPAQAHQVLSGLMRFLYLTQRDPSDHSVESFGVQCDEDGHSENA